MAHRNMRIVGLSGLALAISGVALSSVSAEPSSSTSSSSSSSSSSGASSTTPTYLTTGNVFGEVVKVSSSNITIREKYYVPPRKQPKNGPYNPNLNKNTGWQNRDHTFDFAVDASARIKHLPPKVGADGKKEGYSPDEWEKLKGNAALPGFKADLSQLKAGQSVEAHLVHLKDSQHQVVRWALIINESDGKTPPKTTDTTKKSQSNN